MKKVPIQKFSGQIAGWLEYQDNGDIIASKFSGQIVGRYIAAQDITTDFSGRIIAHGNIVASLIPMEGN